VARPLARAHCGYGVQERPIGEGGWVEHSAARWDLGASGPVTAGLRPSAIAAIAAACLTAGAAEAMLLYEAGAVLAMLVPIAMVVVVAVARHPERGVQLALLFVPLELFAFRFGGALALSPTEGMLLVTASLATAGWTVRRRWPAVPRVLWPVAGLCALMVAGLVVAAEQLVVIKIVVMWCAFVVVAMLVAHASARDRRAILVCLALAGGITGVVALAGGADQTLNAGGTVAAGRAQAGFQQPNVLAFFLVLTIPVAIVLSTIGSLPARLVALACAAGAMGGLGLSLSRTGLVGTALGLVVLLAWRPFRRAAAVGLTAILVFALLNAQAVERSKQVTVIEERLATLTRAGAVTQDPRGTIYSTTPEIVVDHPLLGVGAGNFPVASNRYGLHDETGWPYDHAHDVPLTFAAELGVGGLLLFVAFVAALGRLCWRLLRTVGDPHRRAAAVALSAAMVGVAVASVGDYPPRTNAIAATFLIQVGLLAALARDVATSR
jgi:O-antigen ligase